MKVSKCWIISEHTACLITALNLPWKRISVFKCSLQSAVSQWKIKRERATRETWLASTGSPGVFSSPQPRWPYCVSKQIERLALWQASLCGVQIHRVSTTVLLRSQVTACSRQQGDSVVFTQLLDGNCVISLLAASWKKKNKTRGIDYFVLSFLTKCSPSSVLSNSLSYTVTKDSCWVEAEPYLYNLKNGHSSTGSRVSPNTSISFRSFTAHKHTRLAFV